MAPRPRIPSLLKAGPFTLEEARAAGLSPTSLRGRSWVRLSHGLYCWAELVQNPWNLLSVLQRLRPEVVYSGNTAAWIHGLENDVPNSIEVVVAANSGMRSRPGITVRRTNVDPSDVVSVRGLRATSVLRTLCNLCPRLAGVEALVLLDAAIRLKRTDRATLVRAPSACVRALAPLAEPAESPMETRLRWLLLSAGLPRPEVQAQIPEARARADLYYPQARLIIEYDGGTHRDRMVEDNRRQNLLVNAGYSVLRFTASDIYARPETIVAQVSAAVAPSARPRAAARR